MHDLSFSPGVMDRLLARFPPPRLRPAPAMWVKAKAALCWWKNCWHPWIFTKWWKEIFIFIIPQSYQPTHWNSGFYIVLPCEIKSIQQAVRFYWFCKKQEVAYGAAGVFQHNLPSANGAATSHPPAQRFCTIAPTARRKQGAYWNSPWQVMV